MVILSPAIIFLISIGTNFSGCCRSPKMFIQCVTIIGNLYVFAQASHKLSAPAFVAAYGLFGLYLSHSLYDTPSGAGPKTSSVEKYSNLGKPCTHPVSFNFWQYFLKNSRTLAVPITLSWTNSIGCVILRSTCDPAAIWTK